MQRARAFVIVPLALVLWIGLLILGVMLYLKTPPAGYVPAKGVGPGQIGSVILAVLYGGFWFFVIGRLAEKKGQLSANATAVIVLGLAGVMLTLSYFGLTKDQRGLAKAPAVAGGAGGASNPGASAAGQNGAASGPDKVVQSMRDSADRTQQAMRDAQARDAERLRRQGEMMDRMRQAAQPGGPSGAAPVPGASGPTSGTGAPSPSSSPARAATPEPDPDQATIDRVAKEFGAKLDDAATSTAAALEPVLDALVKSPKQDIRDIKARAAMIDEVRPKLAELSKRFKDAGEDLGAELKAAGVGETKASVEGAIRASKAGWTQRSFAADRVLNVLDKGKEEAELLRDNIGKWKYDKDGKITAKDFELQSKIKSARFFLDADVKGRAKMLDELRGN